MIDTQYYKRFGQNLRTLRESLGKSTQLFTMDCDCSAYTIQNYELGRKGPNLKRFLIICNATGASPNQLLAGLFRESAELLALRSLQETFDRLSPTERQRMSEVFEIMVNCMIDTKPSLVGADFGARLHLLRLDAGFSVDDFAARCSIAKSTLQGYESGQYDPSIPALLQICEVLDVSPEYLLADKLEKTSFPNRCLLYLRPRQLIALHETAACLANSAGK